MIDTCDLQAAAEIAVPALLGVLTIYVTYKAILASQNDNKLAAYISIFLNFNGNVQNLRTDYEANLIGPKLFLRYEGDLITIVGEWNSDRDLKGQLLGASEGVENLINQKETIEERINQYVDCNKGELLHYIHFFNYLLPKMETDLTGKRDKILKDLVKSSVTIHEWAVLYLFAEFNSNTVLKNVVVEHAPNDIQGYVESRLQAAESI